MNTHTRSPDALVVACPSCHGLTRVPRVRLGEQPHCPRCKSPVLPGQVFALDGATFEAHAGKADLPLLVDFWAPWCGPCRMMAPVLEQLAGRQAARLQVAKVNTDEQPALGTRFGIRSIPTLILFQGGQEQARHSGAVDLRSLEHWLGGVLPA